MAVKRICSHPGCAQTTTGRFCDLHLSGPKKGNKKRPNSYARGYNNRWRKNRAFFLSQNPFCCHCEAREQLEPAIIVDHIVPHRGDMQLFWDTDNWQGLCRTCDNRKKAFEKTTKSAKEIIDWNNKRLNIN